MQNQVTQIGVDLASQHGAARALEVWLCTLDRLLQLFRPAFLAAAFLAAAFLFTAAFGESMDQTAISSHLA